MKAPIRKESELKKEKLIAAFPAASAASGETGADGVEAAVAAAPATAEPAISSATTIMVAKAQASSPCGGVAETRSRQFARRPISREGAQPSNHRSRPTTIG